MNLLRSFTFWLITIPLLCAIFVMQLNAYLRGSMKRQIDAVAGTGWFILLVLAFIFLGWEMGLVFVFGSFVLGALIQPFARSLARRMLGYRTGANESQGMSALDRMMAGEISFEDCLEETDKEERHLRQKLERLAAQPDVARVLRDNVLSIDDYVEHYHFLRLCGLSDLAWEIVGDATDLSLLIDMKRNGKSDVEIARAFRQYV